jgi:endonuclease YncB( thermonuclease family)
MSRIPCSVERVIDGDTFVVLDSLVQLNVGQFFIKSLTLRLGGMHIRVKDFLSPERNEVGGSAATLYAQGLLTNLESKIEIQQYEDEMSFKRFVCDVWVNGVLFRELMEQAGHGEFVQFYKQAGRWVTYSQRRGQEIQV